MTERNPALYLQTKEHPAEDLRRGQQALLWDSWGVLERTGLAVTAGAGMALSVSAGRVWIPGSLNTYQGVYFAENRGSKTLGITAGHATLPRKDRIVAQVKDSVYAGAAVDDGWLIAVVQGVPATPAVEPVLPASCVELALVDVPAAAATTAACTITDRRRFLVAPSGVPSFANPAERATQVPTPSAGQLAWIVAPAAGIPSRLEVWTGAAWQRLRPTITVGTGAPPATAEDGDLFVKVV